MLQESGRVREIMAEYVLNVLRRDSYNESVLKVVYSGVVSSEKNLSNCRDYMPYPKKEI